MRRMFMVLMALSLVSAVAIAQTDVTSVNAVGFNKMTLERGKIRLMTVNFNAINGNQAISNVLDAAQLAGGTKVYLWDEQNQTYSVSTPNVITPGGVSRWNPGTNILAPGMSFWISVPITATQETYTLTVNGEVPDDTNVSCVIRGPGLSFITHPFSAPVAFTNLTLTNIAKGGDAVYAWRNNAWVSENYQQVSKRWNPGTNIGIVELGDGLIYSSTATSNKIWNQSKPYNWP